MDEIEDKKQAQERLLGSVLEVEEIVKAKSVSDVGFGILGGDGEIRYQLHSTSSLLLYSVLLRQY